MVGDAPQRDIFAHMKTANADALAVFYSGTGYRKA
ncbi:hypothetical protein SMB34_08655 [Thalassospira permensis NBRC 106175]|uniref:Uncharacterized protein n=1 Tax=Thalassospira permensis NBRC 106175 TaxID=1353532 RepID=A0ABR4TJ55_9PROT|nr:hypothetical protein SMB34_08655 [Thalassospira permensis NBRC 106175]